ncbi:hypothetical protein DVH05_000972 [Phytophthora capsici]|nr:hypothetical protein DVH05_000972 [Phytophthora capsici]
MTSSIPRRFPAEFLGLDAALRQTLDESEKQRRRQHSAAMVVYRKAKKEEQERTRRELYHLEHQLTQLVKSVRKSAARSSQDQNVKQTPVEALRSLVAEQEILRNENVALRQEIERHEKFQSVLEIEKCCKKLPSSQWRVNFDRDVPAFHFSPFTRDEFDTGMTHFDLELELSASSLSFVGKFLKWNVHRAPLVTSHSGSTVARVRLTKRVRCSLDNFVGMSYEKVKDSSPIIVSPIGFGIHRRHEVATQLLQKFDKDALVFAHHIPGSEVNLRYIYFVRRVQWQLRDGRRKFELSMSIVDSHYRRDGEGQHENIEWVEEGGVTISLTEMDGTVDVVCDRWASCQSKLQADYNMVQWAQYASWWEQTVAPDSLLL